MPCDNCISGVENFAKISPALWRGAQPTAEGFRSLEAAGVKTVINLRGRHDDAIREMYPFHFNTIWFRNPGFLRGLNMDKPRGLVALAQ
jgi:hypothetical protein